MPTVFFTLLSTSFTCGVTIATIVLLLPLLSHYSATQTLLQSSVIVTVAVVIVAVLTCIAIVTAVAVK